MADQLIFPRQIGRISFAIRYILFLGAVGLGAFLLGMGGQMDTPNMKLAVLLLATTMLLFSLFYVIRHILIARLRDISLHSLWSLLIFVPVVNLIFVLVLLFVPTDGFSR